MWKQHSNFKKYSTGILYHNWEQRRVMLFKLEILRYFALIKNMEGITVDPERSVDLEKSPWVYDPEQKPHRDMNLQPFQDKEDQDGPDPAVAASSFEMGIQGSTSLGKGNKGVRNVGGIRVQAWHGEGWTGPTPFKIYIKQRE